MPQRRQTTPTRQATPRTTNNSRGLRGTTPTNNRRSRTSSVASDDSNTSTASQRRSRRVAGASAVDLPLPPDRKPPRRNRSRESSIAPDDSVRPPSTPYPRNQARSPSVESETDAAEASPSNPITPAVASPVQQLPLPPVPETRVLSQVAPDPVVPEAATQGIPTTPLSTGPSNRYHRFSIAPALTPITEESPARTSPFPSSFVFQTTPGLEPQLSSSPVLPNPFTRTTIDESSSPTKPAAIEIATTGTTAQETFATVLPATQSVAIGIVAGESITTTPAVTEPAAIDTRPANPVETEASLTTPVANPEIARTEVLARAEVLTRIEDIYRRVIDRIRSEPRTPVTPAKPATPPRTPEFPDRPDFSSRSLHTVGFQFKLRTPGRPFVFDIDRLPSSEPVLEQYQDQVTDDDVQAYAEAVLKPNELEIANFQPIPGPDINWRNARKERDRIDFRDKLRSRLKTLCDVWQEPAYSFADKDHPLVLGEEVGQTTADYVLLKKTEGPAFGTRLFRAIKADHEQRGCECPLPNIYPSKDTAEKGVGTLRFFKHINQSGHSSIRVFMRKEDWHWHCCCHKEPLSDFAVWVRKYDGIGHLNEERYAREVDEQLQRELEEHTQRRADEQQYAREADEQLLREVAEHTSRQTRKRKASDSELDLAEPSTVRVLDGPCLPSDTAKRRKLARFATKLTASVSLKRADKARALRTRSLRLLRFAQIAGSSLSTETGQFMCRNFRIRGAMTMATSVKDFFSRVTAHLSTVWSPKRLQTAVDNRAEDESDGLTVKRFKSIAYYDITTTEGREAWEAGADSEDTNLFDNLEFFHWTADRTKYIGKEHLEHFKQMAIQIVNDIKARRYRWGIRIGGEDIPFPSEEDLRATHSQLQDDIRFLRASPKESWNLSLSLDLLDYALRVNKLKKYTDLDQHMRERAEKRFLRMATCLSEVISEIYLQQEQMKTLEETYGPKPPKHLRAFMTKDDQEQAFEARDFMTLWLAQNPQLRDEIKLAAGRFIVDMDALNKMDIPNSLVEYPGKYDNDVLPGTWPDDLMEEVPTEDLGMTFKSHLQAPDSQPEGRDGASLFKDSPDGLEVVPSRSVLKSPRPFPAPRRRMPGDKPRQRTVGFHSDLVTFIRSPKHKPQRLAGPKTVHGYRVEKARPSIPAKTKELWRVWAQDFERRVSTRGVQTKLPIGPPEDQTMEEAGGWRLDRNPATGVVKRVVPPTKYEQFLDETRQQLFAGRFVMAKTTDKTPAVYWGGMPEDSAPSHEDHDDSMAEEPLPTKAYMRWEAHEKRERPEFKRSPSAKKTQEQIEQNRRLLLADLELVGGELMRPAMYDPDLIPELEKLEISERMSQELTARRKFLKEQAEAKKRLEEELARKAEEERRQKEEEEGRRREAERLRREEEARRQARRQEEERRRQEQERARAEVAAAARRRDAEGERLRKSLGLRRPSARIIRSMTSDWTNKVAEARHRPSGQVFATMPDGTPLTSRDLNEKLLPPTAWLNDNVIIASIQHIGSFVNQKAGAPNDNPKCVPFTSYFWPRLESSGPGSVGRLMRRAGVRKDNLLSIETILIPICSGAHWTLGVVKPQQKSVLHMDSLRGGRGDPRVTGKIMDWVKFTLGDLFQEDQWHAVNLEGPTQTNGYDCGMFSILNSLCMALGLDPKESYLPGQLTSAREWIAGVLVNKGFNGEFSLDSI
ncbi:hypothetical protein GE09DRAFT_37887 [Coniochaeta sp. 2T2.1]|nr:hypothetical protein GE09DRAFT_37887 [Coniochaeta sp. 2T2.1]